MYCFFFALMSEARHGTSSSARHSRRISWIIYFFFTAYSCQRKGSLDNGGHPVSRRPLFLFFFLRGRSTTVFHWRPTFSLFPFQRRCSKCSYLNLQSSYLLFIHSDCLVFQTVPISFGLFTKLFSLHHHHRTLPWAWRIIFEDHWTANSGLGGNWLREAGAQLGDIFGEEKFVI